MDGIDLYSLYLSFSTWVNTFQGSFWRLQTDYTQVANDISNQLWREYAAIAEKSQEIKDSLNPFLVKKNVICQKAGVYVFAPQSKLENYGRFASAGIMLLKDEKVTVPDQNVDQGKCCNGDFDDAQLAENYYNNVVESLVELVDTQRWKACLDHLTKYPTFEAPKMVQCDKGWYVAPRQVGVVVISYYRRPNDAVFSYDTTNPNFDTGAGAVIMYNKSRSTPLEWGNDMRNEFIIRLGARYGIFNREQFLFEASKTVNK